jgi:hypothetical protein
MGNEQGTVGMSGRQGMAGTLFYVVFMKLS